MPLLLSEYKGCPTTSAGWKRAALIIIIIIIIIIISIIISISISISIIIIIIGIIFHSCLSVVCDLYIYNLKLNGAGTGLTKLCMLIEYEPRNHSLGHYFASGLCVCTTLSVLYRVRTR